MRYVAYNSTTITKRIHRDFSLLSTRHQGSAIGAGSSDLCCSKGRNQCGSEHRHGICGICRDCTEWVLVTGGVRRNNNKGIGNVSTNSLKERKTSCKCKRVIGYLGPAGRWREMKERDRPILTLRIGNLIILYRRRENDERMWGEGGSSSYRGVFVVWRFREEGGPEWGRHSRHRLVAWQPPRSPHEGPLLDTPSGLEIGPYFASRQVNTLFMDQPAYMTSCRQVLALTSC